MNTRYAYYCFLLVVSLHKVCCGMQQEPQTFDPCNRAGLVSLYSEKKAQPDDEISNNDDDEMLVVIIPNAQTLWQRFDCYEELRHFAEITSIVETCALQEMTSLDVLNRIEVCLSDYIRELTLTPSSIVFWKKLLASGEILETIIYIFLQDFPMAEAEAYVLARNRGELPPKKFSSVD